MDDGEALVPQWVHHLHDFIHLLTMIIDLMREWYVRARYILHGLNEVFHRFIGYGEEVLDGDAYEEVRCEVLLVPNESR